MVQAVVMAGGRGERLLPLTLKRPKPLVPLFGRPLLGYLLRHLCARGVREVFVTAGHLGEQIEAFVRTAAPGPLAVHCRVEPRPRGTAGAVADLLPQLRSPFLVVSGDAVLDLDVAGLLAAHRAGGHVATICLAPPSERLRFGTVALDGGRVRGFWEKPPLASLLPGASLNTGCYVLEAEALEGLPPDRPADFALDVFPGLLARGAPLGAHEAARYWRDIGTLEAYRESHFDGLAGALPWPLPPPTTRAPELAPGADLEGEVHVGPGVRLGPQARVLGPAVLGERCQIGRGATVVRSVLLRGCRIGPGALVRDSVVDEGACIPPGTHVVGAGIAGRPRLALRRRAPASQGDAALPAREGTLVAAAPPA